MRDRQEAWNSLNEFRFIRKTINHNENFTNSNSEVHIQTIASL